MKKLLVIWLLLIPCGLLQAQYVNDPVKQRIYEERILAYDMNQIHSAKDSLARFIDPKLWLDAGWHPRGSKGYHPFYFSGLRKVKESGYEHCPYRITMVFHSGTRNLRGNYDEKFTTYYFDEKGILRDYEVYFAYPYEDEPYYERYDTNMHRYNPTQLTQLPPKQ